MINLGSAYHTKMINEEERTDKGESGEENEAEKYGREDKERIKGGGGGRGRRRCRCRSRSRRDWQRTKAAASIRV